MDERDGGTTVLPDPEYISQRVPAGLRHRAVDRHNLLGDLQRLCRFLYTNNPFYAISALLVVYGVRISIEPGTEASIPWTLTSLLGGYTVLMALAAYLVVRLGKVWEDARSILLVVVILLVAISMVFDERVIVHPGPGRLFLFCGLGFSLLLSETLRKALRMRLPLLYKLTYYGLLITFFAYPAWLTGLLSASGDWSMAWGILLFPTVAAIPLLFLLPAVYRGRMYADNNGTPWQWPWYPGVLFILLAVGVCIRSYLLSLSFHPLRGTDSVFGLYFLVPFLLVSNIVLFETASSAGKPMLRKLALLMPLGIVGCSVVHPVSVSVYTLFLGQFVDQVGSPVLLTLVGILGFYLLAWYRGSPEAEVGLAGALLCLCIVSPQATNIDSLGRPQWLPLASLAVIQLLVSIVRGQSWRWLGATGAGIAALTIGFWDTPFLDCAGAAPAHLLLAASLLIAATGHDWSTKYVQHFAFVLLVAMSSVAMFWSDRLPESPAGWIVTLHILTMTLLAIGQWRWTGNRLYLFAAGWNVLGGLGLLGCKALRWLATLRHPSGLTHMLWGAAMFVIAIAISTIKGRRLAGLAAPPSNSGGEEDRCS